MKYSKFFLIFIIGLISFSCSKNDDCDNVSAGEKLISIDIEYFQDNYKYASVKRNFYNNRLVSIQDSDGSYDDFYYEGNLVSRILEFNVNNELEWTTEYNYDSSERLISKKVIPGDNNPINTSRHKEISYQGTTINSTLNWSSGGVWKFIYSLNAEGQITKKEYLEELEQTSYYEYENGDLKKNINKSPSGEVWSETTFSYRDESPNEAYFYSSYLYGKHWVNNAYIQEQFTPTETELSKIGGHYIKGYQKTNYFGDYYTDDVTYDYAFDENGRIKTQTENIFRSTGKTFKRVYNFEYK